MALDIDALSEELTERLGSPSDSDLPVSVKTRALESALREFSRYRPLHDNELIEITAAETDYELPVGVVGVSGGWVLPSSIAKDVLTMLEQIGMEVLMAAGGIPLEDLGWPYSIVPGEPYIFRLDVDPPTAASVLLNVEYARSWDDVGEPDMNALLTWAQGECLEYIGRKRNKSISKIPTAVGQLTLNTGFNDRQDARLFKKEFRDMLGQGATEVA